MKNKYQILQGVINLETVKEFTNKRDALREFNRIKRDTKGWIIHEYECLTTWLVQNNDLENPLEVYNEYKN